MNTRLLFVINDAAYFMSHRAALAKAAKEQGYEVHVAAPHSVAVGDIIALGFSYHPITLSRSGLNPFAELRSIYALYRLYRTLQPNIIHHLTIKPILYGGIAARLVRISHVVYAVTGLGYVFSATSLRAKWIRFVVKKGYAIVFRHSNSRVIFQNPDDLNHLVKPGLLEAKKAVLIRGSGVSMKDFLPLPEPDSVFTVVLVARMLWSKGVGEFVGAAKQLQKKGANIRFVLVGEPDLGNPESISEKQLTLWSSEKIVEWWGWQKSMPDVFAKAHVVCLPSYREGVPRVLIEAAACARPIIATDVPGCREIVNHGDNGLLVPVKNIERLAEAITTLANDALLREKMATHSREIAVNEFSLKMVLDKTLDVYQGLLNSEQSIVREQ